MNKEIQFAKTDLLEIAYLEYGKPGGRPLILLHGFPYDVHAYDKAAALLLAKDPDRWHILIPWLRGYGRTRFLSEKTIRSGEQSALAYDLLGFMDALGIRQAYLAGFDWGGRAACIVSAVCPERVSGLVTCGVGYNVQNPNHWQRPLSPEAEVRAWYMYYFNTERGRNGLREKRKEICRYLWETWSPSWRFTQEEFDKSAGSFENPDFVDVVIHSYRCRIGEEAEDPVYSEISTALAEQPPISVPSVILYGADDRVTIPPNKDVDSVHFTDLREKRIVNGAGHNIPQEAPEELIKAIRLLAD